MTDHAPPPPKIIERALPLESHEVFSTFILSDGTTLAGKVTLSEAFRTDQFDNNGFPMYQLPGLQVIVQVVSCLEELKASKQ